MKQNIFTSLLLLLSITATAQNKQTFYLTNMQPQIQSHNGGVGGILKIRYVLGLDNVIHSIL